MAFSNFGRIYFKSNKENIWLIYLNLPIVDIIQIKLFTTFTHL